ncbi:MAG: hypothetical protein JSW25_03415, partial [Thermoplasmata archaeon]
MPAGARTQRKVGDVHRWCRAFALVGLLLLTVLPVSTEMAPSAQAQEEGPGNLLGNPSFERAFDEPNFGPRPFQWSIEPFPPPRGTEIHQDGEEHHNGFHSALVSAPNATRGQELLWYHLFELEEGQSAGMGGWLRTDLGDGGKAILRVGFGRLRSTNSWELVLDTNETTWVELSREAEHVQATRRVYFQCVLSGPGTVWFDDVWFGEPGNFGNPPFIVSVPPLDAAVGVEYTYRARAVDMEGDGFTYDLYRGPTGMTVSQEGDVNWTPTQVPEEAVKVVLRATDDTGLSSYQDFFLKVAEEPVVRPVHAYAYSGYDDPFNDHVSSERYGALLWLMGVLAEENPEVTPTVDVLFSGGDLREPGPNKASVILALQEDEGVEDYISLGYSAFHEPTYDTNPLYDPTYGAMSWNDRLVALDALLARARDPLTGEDLPSGAGGLRL